MFRNKDIKPIRLDEKGSSNFLQKIRNFIQYNNAFVLIVVFVLGISGVALGSEQIREGVLLGKVEKEIGVDNAILLATDIENWEFLPQILDIEEDNEYYYVNYKFKTIGIEDNIWQEVWRENVLKFEKESDRYTNVSDYIAKEIGEVIQREIQLLKDTKKIALEKGRTQRVKVVSYSGLVGKILNLETKVIPLTTGNIQLTTNNKQPATDNLQFTAENLQPKINNEQPAANNEELIIQIVNRILKEKGLLTEDNEQQINNNEQPITESLRPKINNEQSATDNEEQQQINNNEQPITESLRPKINNEQSATDNEEQTNNNQ